MTGEEAYRWLIAESERSACDPFDAHVVASILAVAIGEMSAAGRPLSDGLGLGADELAALAANLFPGATVDLAIMAGAAGDVLDEEEQSVRDILMMYATGAGALERSLAMMIARRCKWPHHLWQDLGLRDRRELSALMRRHFSPMAARNHGDMKWKKFLYRMICGSEGFILCTSPVCSDCDDFENCFGAEDGEARLARVRNQKSLPA